MKVNVAYACNDAYIMHTGISIISLLENNKDIEEICIYFIDMGISEKSKIDLEEIVDKYSRQLIIIPFSDWEGDLPVDSTGRHIKSVYAKIFFGRIPDIDRILYIDSDTIVADSIRKLWNTNMDKYAIAGVETINTPNAKRKIKLKVDDLVINDGVALMNLKLWREKNFEKKCLNFVKKWNGNPPVLSEGTINSVCKGYICRLNLKYNLTSAAIDYSAKEIELLTGCSYYSQEQINSAVKSPCIIHYVSGFHNRPWNKKSTHPFKQYYLKYKKISKWKDIPLGEGKLSKKTRLIYYMHRIMPYQIFVGIYKKIGKANRN